MYVLTYLRSWLGAYSYPAESFKQPTYSLDTELRSRKYVCSCEQNFYAFVFFSPALLMCPLPSPLRHRPCPEAESKLIDVVHLLLSGGHLKFVQLLRENMKVKVRGDRSHLLHCSVYSMAWVYVHSSFIV